MKLRKELSKLGLTYLIALFVIVFLSSCGSDSAPDTEVELDTDPTPTSLTGNCLTQTDSGANFLCTDYTLTGDNAQSLYDMMKSSCLPKDGQIQSWTDSSKCSHTESNGGCNMNGTVDGVEADQTTWYYTLPTDLIQSSCSSAKGTYVSP